MKAALDWDAVRYFAAVARTGNLARAAAELGVSIATLSRRLRRFEADLGRRLFQHGAAGYSLTAEGRELYERTRPMETAAAGIDGWAARGAGAVPVRITAGTWTGLYLAERMREIWHPDATWLPELIQCERRLDLARREVDIGIRNVRPDQSWLAGRRVGETQFAVYARNAGVQDWIGLSDEAAKTRSTRWVDAHHHDQIVTRVNMPILAYQLARAGVGRVVLPVMIGDETADLTRVSDILDELTSEQWLVCHHEARHEPPIRAALEALATFLTPKAPRP